MSGSAPRWPEVLLEEQRAAESLAAGSEESAAAAERLSSRLEREFPVQWDWCLQDAGPDFRPWLSAADLPAAARAAATKVLSEIRPLGQDLGRELEHLAGQAAPADPRPWLDLYSRAAGLRRDLRLRTLRRQYPLWVFTKHHILGGSHYAYTEGQSDAQDERQFEPGAALCRLDLAEPTARGLILLEDADGVIRDPDVSWDGRRILFAWKKSDREDDYHLYEMAAADASVRQLTHGLGVADYEGVYLPNGDLLFNSTRCVQTVDCWWTEVSNLYTCSSEGKFLRRLTFDQVHDNYPTVMPDGRVIYTRWEYSDRGQLFVQGLFQMNPDGTGQTEFYGNNSWFPTSLLHARGIPGTRKIVAIFSGHHTRQVGKLGMVDPARGRQEDAGTQLVAPIRGTPAERIDAYGQEGDLFQYPFPLSETEFVVAMAPLGWSRSPTRFSLYWVAADGRRELLASDPELSCGQPVPLAERARPPIRPSSADYRKTHGTCYLHDVYRGPGLAGVARGTVQKLRVTALSYRAAGVGWNYNAGPAGDALVSTPVSIGNGSWDVKTVLGEATVHPDGSAFFVVPARTPLYFQPIDERGHAVQTMRSWVTLQPGENASCTGCHESKNTAPPLGLAPSLALQAGPQDLMPFHGPPRGFSFAREIQPILDRHCIRCHRDPRRWEERLGRPLAAAPPSREGESDSREVAFSLQDTPVSENLAKRQWSASYLALVGATERTLEGNRYLAGRTDGLVNWVSAQSGPAMLAPYEAGSSQSRLLTLLTEGHHDVRLTRADLETIACWIDLLVPFCGDYQEASQWTAEDRQKHDRYVAKRRALEALERDSIADWLSSPPPAIPEVSPSPDPGAPASDLAPIALAASRTGEELFVAAASGRQILVVDRVASKVIRTLRLDESPAGLALAPDGSALYVATGAGAGAVLILDPRTGQLQGRIPAGHSPRAPVLSADGRVLFLCDRFRSRLLALDLPAWSVKAELPLSREPVAAALSPDGRWLLVAHLLPVGPAVGGGGACEVAAVRTADVSLGARIRLPPGSTSLRGICVSPDGRHAYVVHELAHPAFPTTQVDRGWMNSSALSCLDLAQLGQTRTVLLDDVDHGAANPWDVACSPDGRWLCVSHAGTHEISLIDRPALHRKLERLAAAGPASVSPGGPQELASDLAFLRDLRVRVPLPGNGPRGLAVMSDAVVVAEYFSDSLAAVEWGSGVGSGADPARSWSLAAEPAEGQGRDGGSARVSSIPLGPAVSPSEVRWGERLFHDAGICFQRWQSCASCHPDGRADGLNWDLVNDGLGTPKNTRSLLASHRTPPAMTRGVRESAESAVRAGIGHIQSVVRPEAEARAIDAYLKSLQPLPGPHRSGGELSAQARRGEAVFEKAGCRECHPPPLYTSLKAYEVGTGTGREAGEALDTPGLVEIWRTAPYLHHGQAASLEEVLTRFNPADRHGQTSLLDRTEIEDLVAFLLSL